GRLPSRDHDRAAVHGNRLPGHIRRILAEQKSHGGSDVLRLADAPKRYARSQGEKLLVAEFSPRLGRIGHPPHDAIHSDSILPPRTPSSRSTAFAWGGALRPPCDTVCGPPWAPPPPARPVSLLTSPPPPASFIARAVARAQRKVPVRFTRSTRSHSESSMSSARARGKIPALLTRLSGLPHSRSNAATADSISCAAPTSTRQACDCAPFFRHRLAVSSARPVCVPQTATQAPAAAMRSATARPMPCAAPVTMIFAGPATFHSR